MKTIGEINVLQQKHGWEIPTKLTMDDVLRASSDLIRFWELKAPKVLEAVTNSKVSHAKAKAANARQLLTSTVATDADIAKATAAMDQFLERFPQYVPCDANRDAIALFMYQHDLDCRDSADITKAYEKCAEAGAIIVQVGDQQLTGDWLRHAILQTPELLDPLSRKQTAEAQARREVEETLRNTSAEILKTAIQQQFREENAQPSAFEQNRVDQAAASLISLRPAYIRSEANDNKLVAYIVEHNLPLKADSFLAAYDFLSSVNQLELREGNVHQWGGTKVIDYGKQPNRGGNAVNISASSDIKLSLRRKIAGLTAEATAQFWRDNPGAREAYDSA